MEETLKHIEAFNFYYLLGDKRSYTQVARKFTVSRYSVYKWSKAFDWKERIKQTDLEVSKILKKKLEKAVINSKDDYRRLAKKIIDKFKEELEEGKIKISKPQDIIETIKLDLLMMGEPTGREEHKIEPLILELNGVDISKYPKQKGG